MIVASLLHEKLPSGGGSFSLKMQICKVTMTISLISYPIAPVEVLLSNLDIPEIVLNEKINVFAIW